MVVLITGATGRVGATLAWRLVREGFNVRAALRPKGTTLPDSLVNDVSTAHMDLRDQDSVIAACHGVTHIVHLAAQLMRGQTPVDQFYDVNALGTLRLMEGAKRAGTVQRFVLASSDGTYRPGAPPEIPLTEESSQLPADYYGTSKLLSEIILRNHADQYDIPFSITRFATVISPENAAQMFRASFWRAFLSWQSLGKDSHLWPLFHGQPDLTAIFLRETQAVPTNAAVGLTGPDGKPWTISLVDVRDAVEGVYRALSEPSAIGKAFNIAATSPTYHDDAAIAIAEKFCVPKIMVPMPISHHLELNIDAARTFLRFYPQHDFRSTLNTTTNDHIPTNSRTGVASLLET